MAGKGKRHSADPNDRDITVHYWFRDDTLCGSCQAARLLHWDMSTKINFGKNDQPAHAIEVGQQWAAVHCDYFRRRVELPDQLSYCDAKKKKEPEPQPTTWDAVLIPKAT